MGVDSADNLLPSPLDEDEIHDLAYEYIEQEIGRFDWKNNWVKLRQRPDFTIKLRRWLKRVGEDGNIADQIIGHVDRMVKRFGASRWR